MVWAGPETPPAEAEIEEAAKLHEDDAMSQVQIGRGRIHPQLDAQRAILFERCLEACRKLKFDYFYYFNLSKSQCEGKPWMSDRGKMFTRLDAFITRCEESLGLLGTL